MQKCVNIQAFWNFALLWTGLCMYIFSIFCKLSRYVFHSSLQYNPLKVWLYRSGFARFSNTRFSLDSIEDTCILLNLYKQMMLVIKYSDTPETVTWCKEFNLFWKFLYRLQDVHLTNVAIQKNAPDYDPDKGCKWSTQQLRKYLCAKHGVEAVRHLSSHLKPSFENLKYGMALCSQIDIYLYCR